VMSGKHVKGTRGVHGYKYCCLRQGSTDQDFIAGRDYQNRAIGGDIVVVDLLPRARWLRQSNQAVDQEDVDVDSDADDEVT
jgi:hypothetical protein